jgi:hypothetical protein
MRWNPARLAGVVLLLICCTSCISKLSQTVTDIRPATGNAVEARVSGIGVLALTVPELTEEAEAALAAKCNGKNVVRVNSALQMRNWLIVQHYVLTLRGECE